MIDATSSPRDPASASSGILARLEPYPLVRQRLSQRGIIARFGPGESERDFENRLGTELMALYRDTRCEECFEALYAFAQPAVLVWIQSLVRRGQEHLDASDLLQDTFVNVFRYPSGFRRNHQGSFRVWVRTIAGNIVRRARMRSTTVSLQDLPEGCREPADSSHNPERHALADEQSEGLRSAWVLFLCLYQQAYDQLSERDREALRLVEIEGLTYAEAGRRLQVGSSNMKMIIFRSRKRISARMRASMASSRVNRLRLVG